MQKQNQAPEATLARIRHFQSGGICLMKNQMKLLLFLLVFAISIGLYIAAAAPPAAIDTPPWQPVGKYTHPDIRESC